MKYLSRIIPAAILTSVLLMPFSASAAAGLSFGGRVAVALPCLSLLGPSYWVSLVPAPATKQPFYIWTPATLRGIPPPGSPPLYPPAPNPDIPPPMVPGQEVLGVADIAYWCCLPGGVPTAPGLCAVPHPPWIIPGLPGQRMQWANQALSPSTGAEIVAAMKAAATASTATSVTSSSAAMSALIAAISALGAGFAASVSK